MKRFVALIVLFLASCSEQGGTGQASAGDRADEPRIAVLSPALGLILTDLGLDRFIVARHAWDQFLPKSIPSAGDQSAIEYEALLQARPTHVLLEWGERDLPPKLVELADAESWEIENHRLLTLADIIVTTRAIADRFDVQTNLPAALERAWAQQPTQDVGTVLLLMQTAPEIAALGPGSAHHQILTRLGYTPALTEGGPYQVLLAEDVIRLDPSHIVLVLPGSGASLTDALGPLAGLPTHAETHLLTGPADLIPSPRLLSFTGRLKDALAR